MAPHHQREKKPPKNNLVRFTVDNIIINLHVCDFIQGAWSFVFIVRQRRGVFPSRAPLLRTLAQIRKRAVAAYTQADLYRLNHNDYF